MFCAIAARAPSPSFILSPTPQRCMAGFLDGRDMFRSEAQLIRAKPSYAGHVISPPASPLLMTSLLPLCLHHGKALHPFQLGASLAPRMPVICSLPACRKRWSKCGGWLFMPRTQRAMALGGTCGMTMDRDEGTLLEESRNNRHSPPPTRKLKRKLPRLIKKPRASGTPTLPPFRHPSSPLKFTGTSCCALCHAPRKRRYHVQPSSGKKTKHAPPFPKNRC